MSVAEALQMLRPKGAAKLEAQSAITSAGKESGKKCCGALSEVMKQRSANAEKWKEENVELKRKLEELEKQVRTSPASKLIALSFLTSYTSELYNEQEIRIQKLIGKETQFQAACFRGTGSRVPESEPPGDGRLTILFAQDLQYDDPEAASRIGDKLYAATNKEAISSILCCIVKAQNIHSYGESYDKMRMVEPKAEEYSILHEHKLSCSPSTL